MGERYEDGWLDKGWRMALVQTGQGELGGQTVAENQK